MNQTERVIDTLTNSGFPLQQSEIAARTGDPAASIRRVVQTLVKDNRIHVADHSGYPGFAPRFRIGAAS